MFISSIVLANFSGFTKKLSSFSKGSISTSAPALSAQIVNSPYPGPGISITSPGFDIMFTIKLNVNRESPTYGFYKHMGFYQYATRDFHIGNGYYMNDYIMRMEVEN